MTQQHTQGPWKVIEVAMLGHAGDHVADMSNGLMVIPCFGRLGDPLADARLIAAAPELLAELQKAHKIILNALALMTFEQKSEWARSNAREGVIVDGTTRATDRLEVIAKATGGAA
jgi:hypothetical protein